MRPPATESLRTEGFIEIPLGNKNAALSAASSDDAPPVHRIFSPGAFKDRVEQAIGSRTYGDLARMTGVNKETIRRHVSTGSFSFETFTRLCEALGVSADWLLFGGSDDVAYITRGDALKSVPFPELLHAIADELSNGNGNGRTASAPNVSIELRRRSRAMEDRNGTA